MRKSSKNNILLGLSIVTGISAVTAEIPVAKERPNILFCLLDDVSYPHWGAYGCDWVNTPNCDYVARHGVLFENAYTPNAKSGPSRSCILTGRNSWQLEAAANHFAYFPANYRTVTEVLLANGYRVARTGKGWFPGNPGVNSDGQPRELIGRRFDGIKTTPLTDKMSKIDYAANFDKFLSTRTNDKPFLFWFGSWEAHRPYMFGSGMEQGGQIWMK